MQRRLGQYIFTDRSQYPPNRAVEIAVQLRNEGTLSSAHVIGTRHDYEIRVRESRSRKIVWTWSKGKPFPPTTTIRLLPGEMREHIEIWDRRDDSGKRVPTGVYEVELVHAPLTASVTAQIYLSERDQPGENPPSGDPPGQLRPPQTGARVQATITAERSRVRPGETVKLTYAVVNTGTQPAMFSFPSGCQTDMEVRRRPEPTARYATGALTLWQLSRTNFYTMAFTKLTLAPGERKVVTAAWAVGNTPPGTYDLVGYLPTTGSKSAEAIGTITVL
ncbi:MAG: BsuPI-related putative proteinase inhibitor [Armatimonadetes bacterium]|nr:BsuPI-related putative proteinase inhibitor [Armatimonadota bacterium]